MKVLKSWLKDYLPISMTDPELADKLNKSGTQVEEIIGEIDDEIIVVKITKINKHPDADRLQLVTINDGKLEQTVVCGATNIEVGQIVPLAKVGAEISGQKIEAATIRGVKSEGMLCSEAELGLGDDQSGIKILNSKYQIGAKLKDQLDVDPVFELEITPNRGDCLSHLGIARELATVTDKTIKKDPISLTMDSKNISSELSVELIDQKSAPQYFARMIKNVKVGPSPDWLVNRLARIGVSSTNNVVDVTNYIMYDLGQPLHAFDAEKIKGNKIIVRKAKKGESLLGLDEINRELNQDILVIADEKNPIAIAGVIGGIESGISDQTKDIIIEAAQFERKSIRKTSKSLGVVTDASYRFERGIDAGMLEYAINKAAKLIKEVAGGSILSGIVKAGSKGKCIKLKLESEKINRILGTDLSLERMQIILRSLGFGIESENCLVPSWRHDIEVWQDLAEEIGRINGYDKIAELELNKTAKANNQSYYLKENIRDILVSSGLTEVINYSFDSENDLSFFKLDSKNLLELKNPVQPENKYLRDSLKFGLFKNAAKNSSFNPVAIFEFGNVFNKKTENSSLGILIAGGKSDNPMKQLNQVIETIPNKSLSWNHKIIELSQEEIKKFKIRKEQAVYIELNLDQILKNADEYKFNLTPENKSIFYRKLSKYPPMTRDLAFVVDDKIDPDSIINLLLTELPAVFIVELFDQFKSEKLGNGKKSLAFHLYLQNIEQTMTDDQAELIIKKAIKLIEEKFKAKIRA